MQRNVASAGLMMIDVLFGRVVKSRQKLLQNIKRKARIVDMRKYDYVARCWFVSPVHAACVTGERKLHFDAARCRILDKQPSSQMLCSSSSIPRLKRMKTRHQLSSGMNLRLMKTCRSKEQTSQADVASSLCMCFTFSPTCPTQCPPPPMLCQQNFSPMES